MKYLKFRLLVVSVLVFCLVLSTSIFVFADSSTLPYSAGSSLSGSFPSFDFVGGDNSFLFVGDGTFHVEGYLNLISSTNSGHYSVFFGNDSRIQNFSFTDSSLNTPSNLSWFTGNGIYYFSFDISASSNPSSFSFAFGPGNRLESITGQLTFTTFIYNDEVLLSPFTFDKPLATNLYVGNGLLLDLSGQSDPITINFNAGDGVLGCAGFNYGQSFTSGQSYYLTSSNNLTSYNFSTSTYPLLNWSATSTNITGLTTSASSSLTISNPSGYLYIFNPLQGSNLSIKNGQQVNSGYISVSSSTLFTNIYQFELTSISSVGSGQDISITDDGNYINSSGQLVDSSGSPTSQNPGGGTTLTTQNLSSKLQEVFDSLIESIQSIFAPATNSISTLVNSGSAFMQNLVSLYSWLPTQITSVITSALTLFIVIGVLKLLL